MKSNLSIFLSICLVAGALSRAQGVADRRDGPPKRSSLVPPIVINTWNFTHAHAGAWMMLWTGYSALDAVERGCNRCQRDRCDGTVGWGGSPAENGETTLDAMIMDGETCNVGAVAGLRRIKNAIGVARLVLERTSHSLLVGDMASEFARHFGFKDESLTSTESMAMHKKWLGNRCQPNYWLNVEPDPRTSCGPYSLPGDESSVTLPMNHVPTTGAHYYKLENESYVSHDTIGIIAVDEQGRWASATSTNGQRHKILGRVGDSPIAGAGSYADSRAGAAAATGDGDVVMRFLLSYQAVENMRRGMRAQEAADDVIERMINRLGRPYPQVAVVALARDGFTFGSACSGFERFPMLVSDMEEQRVAYSIKCRQ